MAKNALRLLAPYVAVLIFWCGLHSAWLTLIVYHLQILAWSRRDLKRVARGWDLRRFLIVALPCIVAGPITYLMLPVMVRVSVHSWLTLHGLSGMALVLMVPYYGLIHPPLEQAHWSSLRTHRRLGPIAHAAFASYHALVLGSLMRPAWILACVGVLWAASVLWKRTELRQNGGLVIPVLSQIFADGGLIAAAVLINS